MIVVLGSINLDLVSRVKRLPLAGETVTATGFARVDGGKGANQAVAAARLGGDVAFIGAVGDDSESHRLIQVLEDEGINVDRVESLSGIRSGMAMISVDDLGENSIVVHQGPNAHVLLDDDDLALIASADIVLIQLEIPMATVESAASAATGMVMLNAAPARMLSESLLQSIDVLMVNQHEHAVSVGGRNHGIRTVVTTLGADGCDVEEDGTVVRIPSPRIDVVDTTGAGDTFCGAFAEAIDRGESVLEAAAWAVRAAAISTTVLGARGGMPTRALMQNLELEVG